MRRRIHRLTAVVLGSCATIAMPAYGCDKVAARPRSTWAAEVRLAGERVSLPLTMIRGFPFIEGSISGIKGKFMLDTGFGQAFSVNRNRVPVKDSRSIGKGLFGSGQTFEAALVCEVREVDIGGLLYPRVTMVQTEDNRLLEGITSDFVGFFGYQAFNSHTLKMDYRASRATFYKNGTSAYLENERVFAELPFETRKLPNIPIMAGRIGDTAVVTMWDTGAQGSLYTSESKKTLLLKQGVLKRSSTKPNAYDLYGFKVQGRTMPVLQGIEIETTPFPAAKPIGLPEPDIMVVGYTLLHQFKSVWDFDKSRVFLLAQ